VKFNNIPASTVGVTALPQAGCFFSDVEEQVVRMPGMDGQVFAGATQAARRFPVQLIVQGMSREDLHTRLDAVTGWLAGGPARLQFDELPDRWWTARLSSPLTWVNHGRSFRVACDVVFTADDPHPRATVDDVASFTATTVTVPRTQGNLASYPVVTVAGVFTAAQTLTLDMFGQPVVFTGPLTVSERLVLDYDAWTLTVCDQAGSVLRSAVPQLDTVARVSCPVGGGTVSHTRSGGTVTRIDVACRSRWW
jgi:predicted phage tail component-like protein